MRRLLIIAVPLAALGVLGGLLCNNDAIASSREPTTLTDEMLSSLYGGQGNCTGCCELPKNCAATQCSLVICDVVGNPCPNPDTANQGGGGSCCINKACKSGGTNCKTLSESPTNIRCKLKKNCECTIGGGVRKCRRGATATDPLTGQPYAWTCHSCATGKTGAGSGGFIQCATGDQVKCP